MREINLRAWDRKNKYMFYAGSLSGVGDFYMARYSEKVCDGEEFYNRFSSIDYEWMRFTGLRDKNDRQIYEGDIVSWSIFPDSGESKVIDIVDFASGCFRAKKRCEILGTKEPHRRLEVIGNIYENPELLSSIGNKGLTPEETLQHARDLQSSWD